MKKRFLLIALSVFLGLSGLISCADKNMGAISSDPTSEETTQSVPSEETTDQNSGSNSGGDEVIPPKTDPTSIPDFIVEIPNGRDPIVLQLTDPQIIDASQQRYTGRLDAKLAAYYATDKVEDRCYGYIRETINAVKPDFIIVTGDIVYGEFDDSGAALQSFVDFMDSFQIPWSPILGNHEAESKKGVDWQCEQFENAKYCLFEQKKLTGNGNYSVGIVQNGELKRVFYMLDSNGCAASAESLANGHTVTSNGFGRDVIKWYTEQINEIKEVSPNTKISFAYHIQQYVFKDAFAKYGFDNTTTKDHPINIDFLPDKEDGDFGYLGRNMKSPWDNDYVVWEGMKALGVDSVFVGHEHCNSASVIYDGIRFQYGQKSSTYDRANYVTTDGTIFGSYCETLTPLVGGTVIPLSKEDGSIRDPYIYLCENAGGNIDWDELLKEEAAVNGLQKGSDLTVESGISMIGVEFDDTTNAYKVAASSQGKIYVNTALLKNGIEFSFSVYVPAGATKLAGFGEFAIRVKPNETEPSLDGVTDGYIDFNSSSEASGAKLRFDEWMTFTVDISDLESCTEWSFVIPAGTTLYLKDLAILTADVQTPSDDLPIDWL